MAVVLRVDASASAATIATAEGRRQWMAVITSPENHRNLARYQQDLDWIGTRVALPSGLRGEGISSFDSLLDFPTAATKEHLQAMGWPPLACREPQIDPEALAHHLLQCAQEGAET